MSVTLLVLGPIIIGFILYALPKGAGNLARGIGAAVAALAFLLIAIKPMRRMLRCRGSRVRSRPVSIWASVRFRTGSCCCWLR